MNKNYLLEKITIYVALLFLFMPISLYQIGYLVIGIKVVRALVWGVVIFIFIFGQFYKRNIKFNGTVAFFAFVMGCSTIMGNGSVSAYCKEIGGYVVIICFVQIVMEIDSKRGFNCLLSYFFILILINTLTVLLFPKGMYANNRGAWVCFFLGEDNLGYGYYMVTTVLGMIDNKLKRRITFTSILIWLCSFYFVFARNIATGIICELCLFILFMISKERRLIGKYIRISHVSILFVISYIVFIWIRRLSFLESILPYVGRSVSFSGRDKLWNMVIKYVEKAPLIGNGVYPTFSFEQMFIPGLTHAHNLMLQYHFWGGILAIVSFIMIIQSVDYLIREMRGSYIYICCAIGLLVMAIRFIMETSCKDCFWLLLALSVYISKLTQNNFDCQRRIRFNLGRRC